MSPAQGARQVEIEVRGEVLKINSRARSRATRGVNILRNTALSVLGQNGSGRRYGSHIASAPGQPPAPRFSNLRRNWRRQIEAVPNGQGLGVTIKMAITSDMAYYNYLDKGTRKMAARPIAKPIKTKARPEIQKLFSDL